MRKETEGVLVIMDMEWIEENQRPYPTQISALRISEYWSENSRLDQIIRPVANHACDWNHMAFTGYGKDDFLRAPDAAAAMNALQAWLHPDDVLCWWSEPTVTSFMTVWQYLFHVSPPFAFCLAAPALEESLLKAGVYPKGSAYGFARNLRISPLGMEHCSADDVNTVRLLISRLHVKPEKIMRYALSDGLDQSVEPAQDELSRSKYVLDLTNKQGHIASCSLIPHDIVMKRVATLDEVVKSLVQPCSCCSGEYWSYSRKRAEENIRKMQLNFIFTEDTGLFHVPSCIYVQNIPYPKIHGSIRYNKAVAKGLIPCGRCWPRPEDENEPRYTHEDGFALRRRMAERIVSGRLGVTEEKAAGRTLKRHEINAMQRHNQAIKERETLSLNVKGTEGHDAFVLTQSGYAFWAAEGYRNFHLRNCPKLNGLSHLHGYARYSDARKFGLSPCKLCKPSAKNDIIASVPMKQRIRENETEEQIDTFCDSQGWKHEYSGNAYYIETPVAKWKLMTDTHPLAVYHMPKGQTEYHKQHRTFLSMTDTVEYIRRHDIIGGNHEADYEQRV